MNASLLRRIEALEKTIQAGTLCFCIVCNADNGGIRLFRRDKSGIAVDEPAESLEAAERRARELAKGRECRIDYFNGPPESDIIPLLRNAWRNADRI